MRFFKIALLVIMLLLLCQGYGFCLENWMCQSDIVKKNQGQRGVYVFTDQDKCQTEKLEVCYKIDSCGPVYCKPTDVEIDDTDKPLYAEAENVQEYVTLELCETGIWPTEEIDNPNYNPEDPNSPIKIRRMYCAKNAEGYSPSCKPKGLVFEASCTKLIGYEKKTIQILQEDVVLKAAWDVAESAKEAEKILMEKVELKLKRATQGKEIVAYLQVLNDERELTSGQKMAILANADIQAIQALLNIGNLAEAKALMQAFTPDGTLLTNDVKTAMIVRVDKYLGE